MRITLHHVHELGPATLAAFAELGEAIRSIINEDEKLMKTLADLQADVAAETTVESSLLAAFKGLQDQVAALKQPTTDPATATAIDALATQIESNTAGMTAAVQANILPVSVPEAVPPADAPPTPTA